MRIQKRDVLCLLWLIPALFLNYLQDILLLFSGRTNNEDLSFLIYFYDFTFGGSSVKEDSEFTQTMFGLVIPIVFNVIYGTFFYRDMHISSTYMYVRCRKKLVWYIRKCIQLILLTAVYIFISVFSAAIMSSICSGEKFSESILAVLITSYMSLLSFTIITTLIINILALYTGTAIAFIINYVFLILLYYVSVRIDYINIGNIKVNVSYFNILDNTIVPWHGEIDYTSIIINAIYVIVIAIFGYLCCRSADLCLRDKENMI